MISRWKAALISSATLAVLSGTPLAGDVIRSITFKDTRVISSSELQSNTLLRHGAVLTDSLLVMELSRVDSIYFSYGRLATTVTIDTSLRNDGIDVEIGISEGEQALIKDISIGGSPSIDSTLVMSLLGIREGGLFDPLQLEISLQKLLKVYNESGYPYAQVWLTGFEYNDMVNAVDLSISVFEGEKALLSNVIFEGISRTDSSVALRTSRLRTGSLYREGDVRRAREYLRGAGLFESVGEVTVEMRKRGNVNIVIPVKEIARSNLFQGAFGFSKKDGGDYILNGSVDLSLRNIAGTGRNASFNWLNDGERYSMLEFKYTEPFLFTLPVHLDAEVGQIVQSMMYVYHTGGFYLRYPVGPNVSIRAGAAVDRNIPDVGELRRSLRQRYRVGVAKESGSPFLYQLHVEGAYKRNYLAGDSTATEGQLLYHVEGSFRVPLFTSQGVSLRAVSQAVLSSTEIPAAERFPLGGARSLRGYRENQFRGERIAYVNVEYWFGEEGRLFLFDDVGTFYRAGDGWTFKNGLGFGLRSSSPLGVVTLSFGVGDRLSLEGTRIHISLQEIF